MTDGKNMLISHPGTVVCATFLLLWGRKSNIMISVGNYLKATPFKLIDVSAG